VRTGDASRGTNEGLRQPELQATLAELVAQLGDGAQPAPGPIGRNPLRGRHSRKVSRAT
jgi:hypothetical protein